MTTEDRIEADQDKNDSAFEQIASKLSDEVLCVVDKALDGVEENQDRFAVILSVIAGLAGRAGGTLADIAGLHVEDQATMLAFGCMALEAVKEILTQNDEIVELTDEGEANVG